MERVREGKGRFVIIAGEAGSGKTRIVKEFAGRAQEGGARFLEGRCLYRVGADPYLPFIEALRSAAEEPVNGEEMPLGLAAAGGGEEGAGGYLPMGLLGAGREGAAPAPHQIASAKELHLEKDRMFEGVMERLAALAGERPLVLFIDDLHWADASTLQLLIFVARNIVRVPLLLLAAYRPEEIVGEKESPLQEALQRMGRERLFTSITLQRLAADDTRAMLAGLLECDPHALPGPFCETIFRETEGNPYFIEEVVKTLDEEGVLSTDVPGWEKNLDIRHVSLPATVKEVIRHRLDRQGEDRLRVLECASIIGLEFTFEILLRVAGGTDEALAEALERLIAEKLIYETGEAVGGSGMEGYRFSHTKIREVVYEGLSRTKRRLLHKKAGTVIEEMARGKVERAVFILAHHYRFGGVPEKAAMYSVLAGKRAFAGYALDEAEEYYKAALDMLASMEPTTENRRLEAEALLDMGVIQHLRGDWDAALRSFEEAGKLFDEVHDLAKLAASHRALGEIYMGRTEWDGAIPHLERALSLAIVARDEMGMADAHRALGWTLWRRAEYGQATIHSRKAIEIADRAGATTLVAKATIDLGNIYNDMGDMDRAANHYREAARVLEGSGNYNDLARAYNNLGDIFMKRADYDAAIPYFTRCVEAAHAGGHTEFRGLGLMNLGECYIRKGDTEAALPHLDEALLLFRRLDARTLLTSTVMLFGLLYARRGEWGKAEGHFEEALRTAEGLGTPFILGEILLNYGECLMARGDRGLARERLERARECLSRVGARYLLRRVEQMLNGLG